MTDLALDEDGWPGQQPTGRFARRVPPTGDRKRINVHMRGTLIKLATEEAQLKGQSLSAWISELVATRLCRRGLA